MKQESPFPTPQHESLSHVTLNIGTSASTEMNFQRKIAQGETSKEDYCLVLKTVDPLKILKVLSYILFTVLFIIENYESMQAT